MFNSFHLQPECYPNYIILIPSLSCFNRSVVAIIPLLTGVSSKFLLLPSSYSMPSISNRSVVVIDLYRSVYISFQPERFHVLLAHCNPFLLSFNLQGSRNVPCSSFLTECFQLCSSSLYSFFQFVQPLKVRGFTRLSKKQLSFTSSLPLPFLSGAILDLGTRSSRSGGVL